MADGGYVTLGGLAILYPNEQVVPADGGYITQDGLANLLDNGYCVSRQTYEERLPLIGPSLPPVTIRFEFQYDHIEQLYEQLESLSRGRGG